MEFKDLLAKLRKEKGLSQEALADIIHVSRSAIAKYENGKGIPSDDVLEAITNYFPSEKEALEEMARVARVRRKKKINKLVSLSAAAFVVVAIGLSSGLYFYFQAKEIDSNSQASATISSSDITTGSQTSPTVVPLDFDITLNQESNIKDDVVEVKENIDYLLTFTIDEQAINEDILTIDLALKHEFIYLENNTYQITFLEKGESVLTINLKDNNSHNWAGAKSRKVLIS